MKIQLKILSILAAALAVVFSVTGVTMAFSAPSAMANCREIDSGLSFECDPVSNLAVVNNGIIPVSGLGLPSFTTNLRSINDLTFSDDLSLSDFAMTMPFVPILSLSDYAIAHPPVPVTSLRNINDLTFSDDLSLSDFAMTMPFVPILSLSDFAIAHPPAPVTSLRSINEIELGSASNLSLSDTAILFQEKASMMEPLQSMYYFGSR
jgi:hypothetical protein